MNFEVKVPTVGESINEVTVANWAVTSGTIVEVDDPLCELESDKATFEVVAEVSGVIKITAQEGEVIEIGGTLCEIDQSSATTKPETKEKMNEEVVNPSTKEAFEVVVPTVGESINEVTLASWTKSTGDIVEIDDPLCELESDKATFEVPAEVGGKLEVVAKEGDTLEIGALICKIHDADQSSSHDKTSVPVEQPSRDPLPSGKYATGHASPAAAKILAEKEINPSTIIGTGKDGRITKADAMKVPKTVPSPPSPPKTVPSTSPTPKTGRSEDRGQERKKMTSLRKTISRRLVSVKNETAMLTTFNELNMKPIMDLRKKYKDGFREKYEVGLGFMSFFTKACCAALQEYPAVNAMIDGEEIVYNHFCDISIAVSAPKGLVVPVIRNAEKLSFDGIEKEIVHLALKARDNKLTIDEMTGGTFTITNGGIFGSMMSTPIINSPQSAILGMHNIVQRPVVEKGEIVIRPMMYVALSYDHRIIDGKESVSFLVRVKELLEDPSRLLLGI